VDIERVHPANLKIAKRFFTKNERDYIEKSENPNKTFYEIWTKKEACIKHNGKGLSVPLNSFDVMEAPLNARFASFEIHNYIISVFAETECQWEFTKITQKELVAAFK
jgi:4'-phosphopantetheinyl transferase